MKRFSIILAIITLGFWSVASADAYVGFDLQWRSVGLSTLKADTFKKNAMSGNIHTGIMINEDWSAEFGHNFSKTVKKEAALKMKGIHGTVIKHFPMNEPKTFNFLVGLGLVQIKHSSKHPTYRFDLSRCAPRLLGGIEYALTDLVKFRLGLIWERQKGIFGKKSHTFRDQYALSTGLRFNF